PLEAGRQIIAASAGLAQYANTIMGGGLIPASIIEAPTEMDPDQAAAVRDDWVAARSLNPGYPGVLTGGMKWTPTQINPKDMALLELSQFTDAKLAVLLGVPPELIGLRGAGDSLTYSSALMARDQHWHTSLQPEASFV